MEGGQIKAASVSRVTFWRISGVLFAILIMIVAAILLARTKSEADPASKNQKGKVLRYDVFAPIGFLDPKQGARGSATALFRFFYSFLFIRNEDGQLEPDLATKWSYDEESLTWSIQIREGAQFHDESPVTASDVVYSLSTAIEMHLPSVHPVLDRITATNEQTIVISLKKDDPAFLEKMGIFVILKQPKTNDGKYSAHPIGSGPFKFEYRIGNEEVGLTANENYYRGRPSIDKVVFYYQPDKEKSWARLLAGDTDFALGIEPQDYKIIEHHRDRFHFKTTIDPFFILLLYNTHDVFLGDPMVRMALALAIDKQHILSVILRGMGVVPPGNLGYYSSLGHPELKPMPYDPSESLRLLREAGWTQDRRGLYLQKGGKPFELTIFIFEGNRLHESIARHVQLCLNDLGIRVRILPLPFEELFQRYWQKADFQAVITEFADFRNASDYALDNQLLFLKGKQGGISFPNPQITAIADQIKQETNLEKRKILLSELNLLLDAFQPATVLAQRASLDVLSRRFIPVCDLSNMYYRFKLWQVAPASD